MESSLMKSSNIYGEERQCVDTFSGLIERDLSNCVSFPVRRVCSEKRITAAFQSADICTAMIESAKYGFHILVHAMVSG